MKIAAQFIEGQNFDSDIDVIDQNYQKLKCKVEHVPKEHE